MFYFRSLYTIFLSSLLVALDAASPIQNLELEFTEKYPDLSTYTKWRELDKLGELQLKLACTRSYGSFNPATQFIVKALRLHNQKVKFSTATRSKGYGMIRLDLLECDVKLVSSNAKKEKGRLFFLAEGTKIGQLFKLVKVGNSLHLVGVAKVILSQVSKPKHQIASSTSPPTHSNTLKDITDVDPFPSTLLQPEESPPLQPVTGAQIEESFVQDSGAIDPDGLNRDELDEQENIFSEYFLDYLAHAYHESQPPVGPIDSLPHPPLQSMNPSPLQPLLEGQIEDPFSTGSADSLPHPPLQSMNPSPLQPLLEGQIEDPFSTGSAILENHTNFGIPSQNESPQYHLNNTNNTPAGSFQEPFFPHVPIDSPQPIPSQAIFQHAEEPPHSIGWVAPGNKQNISTLNLLSSALRNLSSRNIQIDPLNSLPPIPPALPKESSIHLPDEVEINNYTSNQNALPQYYLNTLESAHQESPTSDVIINSSPSSMSSLVQSQQPYQGFSTGDGFHHPGYTNMDLPKQFPFEHKINPFPPDLVLESPLTMHQPPESDPYLWASSMVLDSSEQYLYNTDSARDAVELNYPGHNQRADSSEQYLYNTDSAKDAVKLINYPGHNQKASAYQNSYTNFLPRSISPDRGIDLISQSMILDSSLMLQNEPYQTDSLRDADELNQTAPNKTASTLQDVHGESYGDMQPLSLSDYGIDPSPASQSQFKETASRSNLRRSAPTYLQEFVH